MTAPGWRTSSRSASTGSASCVQVIEVTRVDLRTANLSGVHIRLRGIHEVSAELARLVAAHNGITSMPDRDDPFDEVLKALSGSHHATPWSVLPRGTAAFLEDSSHRMLGTGGLRIPLPPRSDGLPQSVTVVLHGVAEWTETGFAREHVDATYEFRYSAGAREQALEEVRDLTVSRGIGLLMPAGPAQRGAGRWFGKPATAEPPSPGSASGATTPPPATTSPPPATSEGATRRPDQADAEQNGATTPGPSANASPAFARRAAPNSSPTFEDDLVSLVQRELPTAGRDAVLDTWADLVRIRGEAALPTNVSGRATTVAQALRLPRERWHEIMRLPGAGPDELQRFAAAETADDLQTPGASGSDRTLDDDRPAAGARRVRWADDEGDSLTEEEPLTVVPEPPATTQEPPAAETKPVPDLPSVPVERLLAATHVGVVDDRVVGLWLPGAPDDVPAFDDDTLRRLEPPSDSVFVFGTVRDGRLMAGDEQISDTALAAVLDLRAHGLAPVLWMPGAGQLAGRLTGLLGVPVHATPHNLRFDAEGGKLLSAAPERPVGPLSSEDWFRVYLPDHTQGEPVYPELRVFAEPPAETRTEPPEQPPGEAVEDAPSTIDPAIRSIGIPRAGLPNIPELIRELREQIPANVTVPQSDWDLLPQRLLSNYSYTLDDPVRPGTNGLPVRLGPLEALIMFDPADPRPVRNPAGSSMAPATLAPGPGDDTFNSGESINATYATGAEVQTKSGTTGATRGSVSASVGIGVAPNVLHVVRAGVTFSGTANQSNRSTSRIVDAEGGHVEVNKSGSTLLSYTPRWSFKLRSDQSRRWTALGITTVPDPGIEKLLLWVPDHYLRQASPTQVTAVEEEGGEKVRKDELPSNIFVSGLTGLPQLFDEITTRLRGQSLSLPIGGSTHGELLQKLWNLDMHLDRAVNDKERGYWFLLNDKDGRPIASIEVHAERLPAGNIRVGATSDRSHLEDVRTSIDGVSGGHQLVNNTTLSGSLGFDLVPNPLKDDLGIGVGGYLSNTWTNTNTISAGRTGLWVQVPRYTGHTTAHHARFLLSATVKRRGGDEKAPRTTRPVPGQALIRMPEPAAYEHGFSVDKEALKNDPGDRTEVRFERDAIRGTGRREGDPQDKPLPAHVALGKGIGTGLVKVSDATVQGILKKLKQVLHAQHFLPPEGDEFTDRHWWSHGNDLDSRLENLLLLEKMISARSLDSNYDAIHQDGMPFVLRRRRGFAGMDVDVDSAKINVRATKSADRKPHYVRTVDHFDTVNLAMGMDSAGQSTSASRKVALGVSFKGLFRWLKNGLTNVELQRTVGATDALNFLNNRPELLSYSGSVDEWELTSDYEVTVEFQHSGWQGGVSPRTRDPKPITVEGQTATAHLLPLGDGTETGPTSRFPTSVEALKQAVIYFADFSGMRDAVTTMLGELAGPQGASDQELSTLAGTVGGRAHSKEILNREFTTDQLFDPGFFRDTLAALDISGAMGKTTFLGSTADSFVTGIIKLWLAQASTSDTKSSGIAWQQLNLSAGGADGTTSLTGGADITRRWGRNQSTTDTRTGGTELIQLDFNRAYAYMTTVDLTVRTVLEKVAKFLPNSKRSEVQQLLGRLMIFLLPEPEALAQYADTGLPISDAKLADALNRWKLNLRPDAAAGAAAPLVLTGDVVAKILMRWATEVPELPASIGVDRDELIQTLSELHANGALPVTDAETREAFNRQFDTSLQHRANPFHDMELPEYLRREDPGGRILGHHGVQDMTFDKGETTLRLVERKINEVAPGLLASDPEVWDGKGRMIGRVQGGIDSLQAILARGRDQAMLEDVLDLQGMTFYLVNPIGWLLSDVVEINLSAQLTSQPDVREFRPDTGLENYGHGYVSTSQSRSREGGHTFNYGKFAVGRAAGPDDSPTDPPPSGSGAGGLRTSEGHHRGTTRSENAVSEQTAYDWTGHYRTVFDIELTARAKRLDMSGRPLNNAMLHWFERWTHHSAQAAETVAGRLELQVPRAIAEAGSLRGPASLHHFTPLPELPHNAYVLGTLFGDAYQIAREMADDIFGRKHVSTASTHLNSLATRLRPTHVRNHLWEATAGGGYTLAEGIFMPGHWFHRATMGLTGDLYDMQVIGVAKQGTGTGSYVKHQSGTTAGSTSSHWRSEADVSETTTGTLHPHDPPHTGENKDATTRATAAAQASAGTENYRREMHVKEQGPVVMVRLRGQFRIEADEFHHHLFRKRTKGAHFRSDPITGDVYALLGQAQVAELQAHLAESVKKARAAAAAWPALDGAPAFDLGRLLTDAARKKFDAVRMYQEVARQIRAQAGGDRPLVLSLDQAAFGAETLLSVLRWAEGALSEHLAADEPSHASNALARLIRIHRDLPPRAPGDAITGLINAVNALHPDAGPRALPPEVPAFALDPVTLARDVAHELQAHVRLDVTRPDATTERRWVDSDGRVYAFDPLTFDDTALSADLAQGAGLLPERLRPDVDDLDINAFDLGRLYRTSWIHQRTFEQALAMEINQRRARLAALDPRLPGLLTRTVETVRRSGAEVRSLEERLREVVRRVAETRDRLDDLDRELFALRTELDGLWSDQEASPYEVTLRARIQRLEVAQGEYERDLPALSDRDQDLDRWLSQARDLERDALRILDDLRAAARETVDAERLEAARRRATSLLPAGQRPAAARERAYRRQLTRQVGETAGGGRREWAARTVNSVTGRLDAIESGIAAAAEVGGGISALPSETTPVEDLSATPTPAVAPDPEDIGLAYRWWPAGATDQTLDRLEGLLRDAGPDSVALVTIDEPSQRFVAINRDDQIQWLEFPTGTAAAPHADSSTGAFLALDPTGTLLQPPPELRARGADAISFRQLHASTHASTRDRTGITRPANPPLRSTTEAPSPSATAPVRIEVDSPLPDDPHLYTDGTGYRIGPPELSGGDRQHVGALAEYAPVHWLTHGAPRNGVTLADIANTDRDGAATFLTAAQGVRADHAVRAFLERTIDRRVEETDRLPRNLPPDTWIWFGGRERTGAAIVLPDGRYRHYLPGTRSTLTGTALPEMTGETGLRFVVAHPVTAEPAHALDTPPLTAAPADPARSYAPILWLRRGAPDDGVNVEDVMRDDPDGLARFMAGDAADDAERVTRFMRTTGRGVESATALPTGLPAGTWIWFSGSEFTGAAVATPGGRYLVYVPGIHRTGLRSDRGVRAMMGRTPYTFVIARPVAAPGTSTAPSAGPARSRPRRVPPPTIDEPPASQPSSASSPDPVRESGPPPGEALAADQRFDVRRTTRGRTGIESAAAVSGVESTDLLADAIESGSLDRIVERLVERHPGPSAGDVHEGLAGLNLAGTREEIAGFLLRWRGDFDIRALALLESVSRRVFRRSLVDVVPELPGLWLGWRVGFFASRGLRSRAVEIIDQVRDRPAALSSIVLSQATRRTGLALDLGINFPDAGALAEDVRAMVQRGEPGPAARLLSGIAHDTLSLLTVADVYFTRFQRDVFVDVPALADAVRNAGTAAPAPHPLTDADPESGYDIAQLERALAGVSEGRDIDFRIALKPTRLESHRPFSGQRPVQVRNGHAWMEIRLPLGDPAQHRSAYGRVFSIGFWPDGPPLVTRSGPSVVLSPDTSEYATAAVPRRVSADQLRRGIDFVRTVADRPYFWFGDSCVTFANELHSAVVGGRPFRGLASVAVRPSRRDRLPAPAFPPAEALGDPEETLTLSFPGNRSVVDETAHEALLGLVERYVDGLIADARAGLTPRPVRITAVSTRSGPTRPAMMPLSSRRAAAVRKVFLDALEERLQIWLPARASQIVRNEIPVDVLLLPRSGEAAAQARIEVFAPRDGVRPGDALSTGDWLTSVGRSIDELRPRDAATTGRSRTSVPPGSSAVRQEGPPAADDPRPPWFVAHGALGDGTVEKVDTAIDPSVNAWIVEVTAGMKPAAAAAVRRRILALLAKKDAKSWERLLRSGTLIRRRGVQVKLTFSVEEPRYSPPGGEPAEEGLQTFFSKYGDTSYSEGSSEHRRQALSGRFEPLLFVIEGALSHLSPSVKISAENEYGSGRSIAMEVQSGNRVIANATHGYVGRIRVHATVNRRPGPGLLLPGTARLAFPAVYSSAAEALGPPANLDEGGHPNVRVTDPEVLQGLDHAVNAAAPQALLAGLRTELDALGLDRDVVDELVQEATEEFFNEKTLKDRSQWWLTGSWVSGVFAGKKFAQAGFAGHLEVSGRPRTVRYVTTTEQEVLLRNDIADTALLRDGGEHHSRAAVAPALAGGVEVGDHLITPGVELPLIRSAAGQSHSVLSEGQAKNAIMRKDRLVRYLTEFTMVVKLRSGTHGDREFTVPMLGELGIGRAHAAYFESLALEGASGAGLQPPEDVPAPVAASAVEPELPEPARTTRAQRLVRWLQSRFAPDGLPRPFPASGVHDVDDLLRLADLGPIEIVVPPELHDGGVPLGPLASDGWEALRTYDNVSWLYTYPENSTVVSHAYERGGPAPWRYVLDAGARVTGALFMAPETTPGEGRHPTGYVVNPAVPPAVERPVPPPAAWYDGLLGPLTDAGLDAVADYLRAGGVPQVQVTDAAQERVATAPDGDALRNATRVLKDTPEVLVVAADGSRLSTEDRPGRVPEARFVIEGNGTVRGPLPVWHHVVHPHEPIELAARKGLGPGILRETPGLERLFREAQKALAHQMRVAGVEGLLSATDRQHLARVLAMKFGVPGLRGAYPALMAGGVGHEVRVGGYVFSVAADVQLRRLRRDPVAEGGVSLDSQHKGVAALSTVEQTGIAVGAAVSGRFRARFPSLFSLDVHTVDAGAKRSWTRKILDTTGVKEYRRARTNGDVTRFEYEAVYTLTVTTRRPAGEVQAAHVREFSGKDHWAAVTVSNAFLPETPVSPDNVVVLGQVTVLDLPDDGGPRHRSPSGQDAPVEQASDVTARPFADLGTEFDLNVKGLSALQVRLTGTEELSRHLAEMVAAHNDVPWLSAKGDAFRQVLAQIVPTGAGYGVAERITRTGTPTFLEALARRMIRKGRLRITLPPTHDGWNQEVTIWLRTLGARHEKAITGVTQEQYTEADLRFGEEDGVTDSADASGGAGAVFRLGPQPVTEGDHTTSTKASSQASFGATGGMSGSRGRYTADLGGGLDLNLGTYSGTSHSFGAGAVYELVHRRWRDGESRSAKRVLGIRRGLTLLAPHVRALDHGLPVPSGAEPPVEQGERYLLDRELAMAVSYIEDADATGVLPAIEEILGDVDSEVLRAVRTAFDEEAMRAEYPIARSGGIHQIVTSPAKFWRDRTLWEYLKIPAEFRGVVRTGIRVFAEEEEPEDYRRSRPDVKVTTGGQAFAQMSRGTSRSSASHAAAYGHGRWAGTGEGTRVAGGGHVEYESAHSSKQGGTTTIRDIRRAAAKDGSQEFAAKARWRIEVYQHISPNELFHQAGRAVSAVPRLVEILSRGESLRLWQRFFPPGRAPLRTGQVDVRASALVPEHLTTTAPPVAAPPGTAVVAISRTPAPEPSPLAKVLAEYMHALATPGSGQLPPWAPVAAVPWRRIDPQVIRRGVAPYFEEFAPDTQDRFTIELALTERDLRANIAALLKGTYRIPLLDGTFLTVQLVPRNGRWLTRGGYSGFNFPEDSTEPERETEVRSGWGYGFDVEVGHPVGKPLAEGAETPLSDAGAANDRGRETVRAVKRNSTGDYVESNIQRDGDYDYYRFDAEFVISGPHAHTVSVGIANGLIGMLPSAVLRRIGSLDGLGAAEPATTITPAEPATTITPAEPATTITPAEPATTMAPADPLEAPHHGQGADILPAILPELGEHPETGIPALSVPDTGRPAPGLSEAQAVRLARLALRAVDMPADGDSLIHALIELAPHEVSVVSADGPPTPARIRSHVADALTRDLDLPEPDRRLWPALDGPVSRSLDDDRLTFTDPVRRHIADALRGPGGAADPGGEVVPVAAGIVFGLTLSVVGADGDIDLIGASSGRDIVVARIAGDTHDHWMAAVPVDDPRHERPFPQAGVPAAGQNGSATRVTRSVPARRPVPAPPPARVSAAAGPGLPPVFLDQPRPAARENTPERTTVGTGNPPAPYLHVDPDGTVFFSSTYSATDSAGRPLPPEEQTCVQVGVAWR